MGNDTQHKNTVLKILVVGLVGIVINIFLTASAVFAFESIFPENDLVQWGVLLWGEHWFLRLVVSLTATSIAGFVVGMSLPEYSKFASTFAAAPITFIGLFGLYTIILADVAPITLGSWITILGISLLSIPSSRIGARFGNSARNENKEIFNVKGRIFGIHWVHILWIWLPVFLIYADMWFTIYYFTHLIVIWEWNLSLGIGRALIGIALFCQGAAISYGIWNLMCGKSEGLNSVQVAIRVLGAFIGLPLLAIGSRALGFIMLNVDFPFWLNGFFRGITGI
jgi:hypothetical protein